MNNKTDVTVPKYRIGLLLKWVEVLAILTTEQLLKYFCDSD